MVFHLSSETANCWKKHTCPTPSAHQKDLTVIEGAFKQGPDLMVPKKWFPQNVTGQPQASNEPDGQATDK